MNARHAFGTFSVLALGTMLTIGLAPAYAQRDANAKIRGDFYNWKSSGSSSSVRSAPRYSQPVRVQSQPAIVRYAPAPTTSSVVTRVVPGTPVYSSPVISSTVVSTPTEMRANPEMVQSLRKIQQLLATAASEQETLQEECGKDTLDSDVLADRSSEIAKNLEKAIAEHEALMRQLGLDPAKVE